MPKPNALQMRVLEELERHPHGGVDHRDLALLLKVRSVYSSLRMCERNGWVRLYTAGFDGGLRWSWDGPHHRTHEPADGDEWAGDFWMITDAGSEALVAEYLRQNRQKADAARDGGKAE